MEITDSAPGRWFLTPEERGNPSTDIDRIPRADGRGWVAGNAVRPVLHGANYFARLYEELCALQPGDRVYFTDWCGDGDERLRPEGPTVGETLSDLAKNGIEVRGLIWRSHSQHLQYNAQQNQYLGNEVNEAGGEVLLDQRIRRFGSHHQKLFVIRHHEDSSRDVAF
ncbi:MAG TPA: phospholipase, partial [Propionibacteriaceae bacterium]|nr:phospholipase [Propionibacteriaceae bacterium]